MKSLIRRWSTNEWGECYVKPFPGKEYFGVLGGDFEFLKLVDIKKKEVLWSYHIANKRNRLRYIYCINNFILIGERDSSEDLFWILVETSSGKSHCIGSFGEDVLFRIEVNGVLVFMELLEDYEQRVIFFDIEKKVQLEAHESSYGMSIGFNSGEKFWVYKTPSDGSNEGSYSIGCIEKNKDGVVVKAGIKLRGEAGHGELCYIAHNDQLIAFCHLNKKTLIVVFDWEGNQIAMIDVADIKDFDCERPQGLFFENTVLVLESTDDRGGAEPRITFVALDVRNQNILWREKFDMGVVDRSFVRAGNYLVNPMEKNGLLKDWKEGERLPISENCLTRFLNLTTGNVTETTDDIGKYIVGTENGLFFAAAEDREMITYAELI